MSGNGNGKDLGIRPIGGPAKVNLRIPPIEGVDPQVLVVMVQQVMTEIHPFSPLTPPQEIADAACAVVGDLRGLPGLTKSLLEAPDKARWRLEIVRPLRVQMGEENLAEIELVLEAPCRLVDCQETSDMASFVTMIGYLTSPVMRGLLRLSGRRARITPPFVVEPAQTEDDVKPS